jgi:16S rRNA processing protein RimM
MSDERDESSDPESLEELIAVATIVRTRGLRGEVVAELLTDFPERFDGLESLVCVHLDRKVETLKLEEQWLQKHRIVFKFAGYDSIEDSLKLVGSDLAVPISERVELEKDEFYDWELTGCGVENIAGEHIGQVRDVVHTGATDLLVVAGDDSDREYLIPLADEICVEIDIVGKLIRIDPPDGLLEL